MGLAFHGHDESQDSSDKGNFLELLHFLANHNESINEVLQKALKKLQAYPPWNSKRHCECGCTWNIQSHHQGSWQWVLFNISWWVTWYLSERANGPHSSLCDQKMNYYRVVPWYCTCSKYRCFVTQICCWIFTLWT